MFSFGRYRSFTVLSEKLALVFFNLGINKGNKKSVNPTRPPANNINLSLIMGVEIVKRLEITPIPPSIFNRSVYGFFTLTSTTEAILPPYLAGIFA